MLAALGDHALDKRIAGWNVIDQPNDEAGADDAILGISRFPCLAAARTGDEMPNVGELASPLLGRDDLL
jgi:hypothetical protein